MVGDDTAAASAVTSQRTAYRHDASCARSLLEALSPAQNCCHHWEMANDEPVPAVILLRVNACWTLLRSVSVGRLAVCLGDQPDIFPVNFIVDHGTIVFRTGPGSKLAVAVAHPSVAFEADGYQPDVGEAWSVVVKGRAEQITLDDLMDTVRFPLFPWHAGPKQRFIRVVPGEVTGRRFHIVNRAQWRAPLTDSRPSAKE
jgi:uncharacterized protein